MRPFEYARPETEAEALAFLNDHGGNTAVLAGGTDLLNLLKADLLAPARVVDINGVDSLKGIHPVGQAFQPAGVGVGQAFQPAGGSLMIGALATLEEILDSPFTAEHPALRHVAEEHRAIQIQQMGTLGGDLCHLPNCWYFRNGYGLLGMENGRSLVEAGDNRHHAVLGNRGPAKFTSASRFAPALIACGAKVRIAGPEPDVERWLPLEDFYITPKTPRQGVTVLKPGQLLTHVAVPDLMGAHSASYEALELNGLDWPLAAAACCLDLDGDTVRTAKIVLGHVAPTPWIAREASQWLIGRRLDDATIERAAEIALEQAAPLKDNRYKVRIARTCIERALMKAAGVPVDMT